MSVQSHIENMVLINLIERFNLHIMARKKECVNKSFMNTLDELCFEFRPAEDPSNKPRQNETVACSTDEVLHHAGLLVPAHGYREFLHQ
jgi:hypothetical protein